MSTACRACGIQIPAGTAVCPDCGTIVPTGALFSAPTLIGKPRLEAPPATAPPAADLSAPTRLAGIVPDAASTAQSGRGEQGPLTPGQQFGPRYHIKRLLGLGGMGAVYQAWDTELGVEVAIKLIRPEIMAEQAAATEIEMRFKRELLLARLVSHRNVVRIHDLGEIDGIKYITMSYVDGTDLGTILAREGRLPLGRVLVIARRMCAGLVAAHAAGVIHRDLKPANIMIGPADEAYLTDFGIARLTADDPTVAEPELRGLLTPAQPIGAQYGSFTQVGSVIGTVEYMPPEQARGDRVDQRADVYALGLIMYDMLAGPVRRERITNPLAELAARGRAPPPSLSSLDPTIPEALSKIVTQCLEPNPQSRMRTSAELAAALETLDAAGRRIPVRRSVGWLPLAVFALLLLGAVVAWWQLRPPPGDVAATAGSIAVLPFVDLSAAKDQGYLADGMSDELLNLLSRVPELRVAARTSAFAFKGRSEDVSSVARQLHVRNILEGSIRTAGNRVRVSTQLVRADTGYQLWSETYDRDVSDIFKLEDEIAAAVVQALKIALLHGALPARALPSNREAYNLYLQGRFFADLHTKDGVQKAIEFLGKSIELDRGYAPSWTALALAYSDAPGRGFITSQDGLAKARDAATEALKLDPKSAAAHAALGLVHMKYDWDWSAADQELKQALAMDPGNAVVLSAAGYLALVLGRPQEAAALYSQTLALDPLQAASYSDLGIANEAEGKLAAAETALRKSLALKPTAGRTNDRLALVLLAMGKSAAAEAALQQESDEAWRLQGSAIVAHALGHKADSDAALAGLTERYANEAPYAIATVHAARGEPAAAFEWLARAVAEHDPALETIKVDRLLAPLRPDARYQDVLAKLRLPP